MLTVNKSKIPLKKLIYRDRHLLVMCIPMFLFFLIFAYLPMAGLFLAFVDFKPALGITGSPFVGLDNFIQVFRNPFFPRLLRNTFLTGLYTLVWSFPFPIMFALAVNEIRSKKFQKIVQTISYMPYFISVVVIVGLLSNFLSPTTGVINELYSMITGKDAISFMTEPKYFRFLYVASNIWQTFGWNSIIYLAALAGVDIALYESARVDGANRFKQVIHITLPSIMPTIIIMLVLNMGNIMSVGFEKIILMYSPSTYEVADVISTYTFRRGIVQADYSFGTAIGMFNSVINMVFIVGANWFSRKFSETSLW
ncbi:MAG TPA: sugar ABC transporter permease [Candidatus Pelethocola excrementipullorum]|nr:sugar ABC transporter permease [Candidatus Pelethocola excrementipullorum]